MKKQLIVYVLFCLSGTQYLSAQWTTRDSVRLNNILTGNDTIRLNPETMDAIRRGQLINPERPNTPHMGVSPELPIIKNFDEYLLDKDSTGMRSKNWAQLPPTLFIRFYNPEMPEERYTVNQAFLFYKGSEEMTDPSGGPLASGDFVHPLNMLFSPTYRQQERNSKKAREILHNPAINTALQSKREKYRNDYPEMFPDKNGNYTRKSLPLPHVISKKNKDSLALNLPSANDSLLLNMPADTIFSVNDSLRAILYQ